MEYLQNLNFLHVAVGIAILLAIHYFFSKLLMGLVGLISIYLMAIYPFPSAPFLSGVAFAAIVLSSKMPASLGM